MNKNCTKVTIIIDVFRAFTTACYVLEQNPSHYIYTNHGFVIEELLASYSDIVFIGKNEVGSNLKYDIANSPTRVSEIDLTNKTVMHRSEAGAKGILSTKNTDIILAASFVNASATTKFINQLVKPEVNIIPMGHEADKPSVEDDVCAAYIQALLNGKNFNIDTYVPQIKNGPGKYFFLNDQLQYPKDDFKKCLELNRFDFAVEATLHTNYATLFRRDQFTKT